MSQTTAPLYERLGRREGITRITKDMMAIHLANPLVKARFENSQDLARVERLRLRQGHECGLVAGN